MKIIQLPHHHLHHLPRQRARLHTRDPDDRTPAPPGHRLGLPLVLEVAVRHERAAAVPGDPFVEKGIREEEEHAEVRVMEHGVHDDGDPGCGGGAPLGYGVEGWVEGVDAGVEGVRGVGFGGSGWGEGGEGWGFGDAVGWRERRGLVERFSWAFWGSGEEEVVLTFRRRC